MIIKAKTRELLGKKVKKLRAEGEIPAVVYGGNIESTPIKLDKKEFSDVYKKAGEATLVDLEIDNNKSGKILFGDIQLDPVTDEILHVDLKQIDLSEKITATVPIETVGESPAEKRGEGFVLTLSNEIEIRSLPTDLPSKIEIDVSNLEEVGEGITFAELDIDRNKVEIVDQEEDALVIKVAPAEMEELEEIEEQASPEDVIATAEKGIEEDLERLEESVDIDEEVKTDEQEESAAEEEIPERP